jgi:alkylation response protein AidB-like acyl-CoA dehydrogenase
MLIDTQKLTDAQKQTWLTGLASGEVLGCSCLSELHAGNAVSTVKVFASEAAETICSDSIQVHGGYGYMSDCPVERIYGEVRACHSSEGVSDIERLVIGHALASEQSHP